MSPASHAQRIVQAWDCFNYIRFETELECAMAACGRFAPNSELESEEQAVLESVVRQFRSMHVGSDGDDARLGAGFLLLRNLQAR